MLIKIIFSLTAIAFMFGNILFEKYVQKVNPHFLTKGEHQGRWFIRAFFCLFITPIFIYLAGLDTTNVWLHVVYVIYFAILFCTLFDPLVNVIVWKENLLNLGEKTFIESHFIGKEWLYLCLKLLVFIPITYLFTTL